MTPGSIPTGRVLMTAAIAVLTWTPCAADDRDEAILHEQRGEPAAALSSYDRWLSLNPEHPDASSTLIHAASLSESPLDAIGFLSTHAEEIPAPAAPRVFARLAELESLVGLPAEAAVHYERAAKSNGPEADAWRLEAAILRMSMGDLDRARDGALEVARTSEGSTADDAAAVASFSLALQGHADAALRDIANYLESGGIRSSPLPYLAEREIAAAVGDRRRFEEAGILLSEHFAGSAALYLAERRIKEWISPAVLLRARAAASGVPIQVGAFRSRDGALDLRSRLEEDGFTSWIESLGELWKVLVNDPDGNTASRLAAAGY